MKSKRILFWQPKKDYLRILMSSKAGKKILIVVNYSIWLFLFWVSYLLVKFSANIFWQLLISTVVAEAVERFVKGKIYWRRPLFTKNDDTPPGLVDKWYKTGSFPSGHAIKAMYFFLFVVQYGILDPTLYLIITVPLLVFRVLIGFHYPIDIVGGLAIGTGIWMLSTRITFPQPLVDFAQFAFNLVFFIH